MLNALIKLHKIYVKNNFDKLKKKFIDVFFKYHTRNVFNFLSNNLILHLQLYFKRSDLGIDLIETFVTNFEQQMEFIFEVFFLHYNDVCLQEIFQEVTCI